MCRGRTIRFEEGRIQLLDDLLVSLLEETLRDFISEISHSTEILFFFQREEKR